MLSQTCRSCMAWVMSPVWRGQSPIQARAWVTAAPNTCCVLGSLPLWAGPAGGNVLGQYLGVNPLSYDSSCLTARRTLQPRGWDQGWARRGRSRGTGLTSKFLPNRPGVLAPHGEVRKSWIFRRKLTVVTCWSALEPCALCSRAPALALQLVHIQGTHRIVSQWRGLGRRPGAWSLGAWASADGRTSRPQGLLRRGAWEILEGWVFFGVRPPRLPSL